MKRREIHCPKFCAAIFLLTGLGDFLSIVDQLLDHFVMHQRSIEPLEIVGCAISGAATLFISIVLFKKHYDELLLGAISGLIISKLFSMLIADYVFVVGFSVIVDVLLLFVALAFVRDSEKEKAFITKIRYAVPILNIVSLVIQGVFVVTEALKQMGDNASLVSASIVVAMVAFIPGAVLAAINYFKLVAWLVEPYEEKKVSKKKKRVS